MSDVDVGYSFLVLGGASDLPTEGEMWGVGLRSGCTKLS